MTDYRQTSATPPSPQTRAAAPGRAPILAAVTAALEASGERWAWQGEAGEPQRWAARSGPKDLDIWYAGAPSPDDPVAVLSRRFPCARVAEALDPRRLRHVSLSVETPAGPAVVDITYGDLCVGPILLVPGAYATVDPDAHRFIGAAAVADLLVRPVLRGRLPTRDRLDEARAEWAAADPGHRRALTHGLTVQLGARVAGDIIAVA